MQGAEVLTPILRHLEPSWIVMNQYVQPVSITCLYDDLLQAIDTYSQMIATDRVLEGKFRQVADALLIPESTRVCW